MHPSVLPDVGLCIPQYFLMLDYAGSTDWTMHPSVLPDVGLCIPQYFLMLDYAFLSTSWCWTMHPSVLPDVGLCIPQYFLMLDYASLSTSWCWTMHPSVLPDVGLVTAILGSFWAWTVEEWKSRHLWAGQLGLRGKESSSSQCSSQKQTRIYESE